MKKIIFGSDHAGYRLKEELKSYTKQLGYEIVDIGCYTEDPVDYPDIAFLVANYVASEDDARGIIIDAVGIASAMVANKVKGIRAAVCWNIFSARSSRAHNDSNILTLGGRVLGNELGRAIVKTWLETKFEGERHLRRINKIKNLEKKCFLEK